MAKKQEKVMLGYNEAGMKEGERFIGSVFKTIFWVFIGLFVFSALLILIL